MVRSSSTRYATEPGLSPDCQSWEIIGNDRSRWVLAIGVPDDPSLTASSLSVNELLMVALGAQTYPMHHLIS